MKVIQSATLVGSALATADRNNTAKPYTNTSNDHEDVEVENAAFLSPSDGTRNAVVFTNTGHAFSVNNIVNPGGTATCSNQADYPLSSAPSPGGHVQLRRRKTHTRLQHEVDFWVPKSLAQAEAAAGWENSGNKNIMTCVVYSASAVAQFAWIETSEGDMIPHINTTTTVAEGGLVTRLMCDNSDSSASSVVGTNLIDAEFHLPTGVLSNQTDFDMPTFTLDQVNIKQRNGCNGTYEVFGFVNGLCVVTEFNAITQALGGALFCMTNDFAGDKFWVYTISAVNKVDMYFPFQDLDFFDSDTKRTRGQRNKTIESADGSEYNVCRVTRNLGNPAAGSEAFRNKTTVSSKGRVWDPTKINNSKNQTSSTPADELGDWVYTVSKTTVHDLSQDVECIEIGTDQGFDILAGQSGTGTVEANDKFNANRSDFPDGEEMPKTKLEGFELSADGGNYGVYTDLMPVDGFNAFSYHIEQEGSSFTPGSESCYITQLSVLSRGGIDSSKFVVYGLCSDGSLICVGGGEDGMETATHGGCAGDDTIVEPGTFRGDTFRLLVNGYFMEPDANAHKQDSTGAPKGYTGWDPAGSGGDLNFYSTKVTNGDDPASGNKYNDPGERTNGLYDGTMYDITGNMSGGETAVCIKGSAKVLGIQTASGRLLLNSTKMFFPYKYGVVYVTQPLRTKDLNKEWRQGAAPQINGAALGGVGADSDGRATTGPHGGLPYGDDWLPTEQGYNSLRDAKVKEGAFFQLMMGDMPNTNQPNQIQTFAMGSMHDNYTDNVWASGNQGSIKVLRLDSQRADWKEVNWFKALAGTAADETAGPVVTVSPDDDSAYEAWNGHLASTPAVDTDIANECKLTITKRNNLTFCLSSVGICSFHQESYNHDAVRKSSGFPAPAAGGETWGYNGANDNPDAAKANDKWADGMTASQWGMANNMTWNQTQENLDLESPKCLQIYRYIGGCVLLTGIDDTSKGQRNNDYFDCNIAVMLMNYRKCVQEHNKVVFGSVDTGGDVFSITYGKAGGTPLETSVGANKVLYMANTLRTADASHLFETGGNEAMKVEMLEFKCACVYDVSQQVTAGILTASGSLGSSTQNEVSQNFDVCIVVLQKADRDAKDTLIEVVRPNFNYYRELEHGYLASAGTSEAESVANALVLRTCAEDPQSYGNDLPTAMSIAGKDYVLAVIQDERSMPPNTSFLTSSRIYPSNHANTGDNAGINWTTIAPNTGLSENNCSHRAGFAVGESITDGVPISDNQPEIPRSMLTGDKAVQNKSMAIFAFELPSTAWLGYSFNLYYVKTKRCSTINHQNCRKCGEPAADSRRRLEGRQLQGGGSRQLEVFLKMDNPKYILNPAGTMFDGGSRAADNYLYDSAAVVALMGMIATLF